MLVLEAIWSNDRIHILGVESGSGPTRDSGASTAFSSHAELRSAAGELWDSLLVSAGQNDQFTLQSSGPEQPENGTRSPGSKSDSPGVVVPTLSFATAEAVDVFNSSRWYAQSDIRAGASFR